MNFMIIVGARPTVNFPNEMHKSVNRFSALSVFFRSQLIDVVAVVAIALCDRRHEYS